MGIYIKNMEMPKNCDVCPFCDYASARCDAVKGTPYTPESRYEKRADFCPLVGIPPHGRLIDADELEQDVQKRLLMCNKNDNQFQKPYEVMRAIALAITIISAEEGEA